MSCSNSKPFDLDILIIDDAKDLCEVLSYLLIQAGFTVKHSSCPLNGLHIIEKESPSLVLMDLLMPGMSGLQMLEKIKELNFSSSIVVISGLSSAEQRNEVIRLGALDFIEKPFDVNRILEQAKKWVEYGNNRKNQKSIQ